MFENVVTYKFYAMNRFTHSILESKFAKVAALGTFLVKRNEVYLLGI